MLLLSILFTSFMFLFGIFVGRICFPKKYIVVEPVPIKPTFKGIIFINNYKIQGDNLMTKVPFNSASTEIAFGAPVDKFNNPAQVESGSLQISSTDDSILTVEPSEAQPENPYAVKVKFTGKAGAAQVQISADADLGEGVKTITGAETFETTAGEASGFGAAVVGEFVPNA